MKKLMYLLIILVIISAGIYIFLQLYATNDINEGDEQQSKPVETNHEDIATAESFVSRIVTLATEGKIIDGPFQAGKSQMKEINDSFGEPIITDQTVLGDYTTYKNDVTVGYQKSLAFDLRSYNETLQQIHLSDIRNVQGEPDETRYYKDENVDQIILAYNINSNYQLKWILPNPTEQQPDPVVHHISVYTEPPISEEVLTLLQNMSLEEKIGQMIFAGVDGANYDQNAENLIHQYHVGGIIFNKKNFLSVDQTNQYVNKIKSENAAKPLPIFLGVDQEGGRVAKLPGALTPIPPSLQIGNVGSSEFSYAIGSLLGKEVKSFGFNMNFAPVLDINSNPNNPVIGDRSFGNTANIVSKLGIETMKGIQSEDVIAVIKHFPGHGDTATDSHLELPRVNKTIEELEELELVPFRQAIQEGADVVMIAHILLPQVDAENPSSMSKAIISDLLRNQLQYDGVVITDDMTMEAITDHYDIGAASVQSVKAGSDIIMVAHDYNKVTSAFRAIQKAVENGEISEERINDSVVRIIQLKEKYQLKDDQIESVDVNALNQQIQSVLNKHYY
ncbi:beta-N-acetylhexosaminidase [Ureibacillus manganicus]|uniref:beta-N-acetylhexosaminidase n=1 Tax=Ureibacillus manganicus TaxID=1266064 RepID=UPI000B15E1B0|nr:beta-N-acetylhexosaminidase [Ureibacillus manganicus]